MKELPNKYEKQVFSASMTDDWKNYTHSPKTFDNEMSRKNDGVSNYFWTQTWIYRWVCVHVTKKSLTTGLWGLDIAKHL